MFECPQVQTRSLSGPPCPTTKPRALRDGTDLMMKVLTNKGIVISSITTDRWSEHLILSPFPTPLLYYNLFPVKTDFSWYTYFWAYLFLDSFGRSTFLNDNRIPAIVHSL